MNTQAPQPASTPTDTSADSPTSELDGLGVIVLGGLKGGLGKSTSAWILACALARRTGRRVVGVDADPKSQTLADSYRVSVANGQTPPFHLLTWPQPDGLVAGVRAEMDKTGAELVVVDTGGDTEQILEQACLLGAASGQPTDLIIPMAPNLPDLRRIDATLSVAARCGALHSQLWVNVLLTACDRSARDEQVAREWLTHADRDYPVLDVSVPDTVAYKRAMYAVPDARDIGIYDDVLDRLATARAAA